MAATRGLMGLVAIAALGLGLASCSRNITRVEQVVAGPQGCFECHSDTSTFLVAAGQQWEHSRHATGSTLNENDGECKGCHTSEGFIARATNTAIAAAVENPTSIHCFTCHAPHTNGDFRLRWTAPVALMNGVTYDLKGANTCVACHKSRRDIRVYIAAAPARTTLSNRFGPHHGPQSEILIGTGGYEYAGYTYERTNHRSALDEGCLDCHMKTTLQNVVGGHSFNMEYELGEEEVLNTAACAECHGEIDDFDEVGTGLGLAQGDIDALMETLTSRLVDAGLVTVDGETVTPVATKTSADSAGAVYNLLMAKEDASRGVHNPKYVKGLLQSAIDFLTPPTDLTAAHAQRAMAGIRRNR